MARNRKQAPGQRQLRVGEELRHILADIFERNTFRDPALFDVKLTVTEVRPSPDLRHARIYIVPLGGGNNDAILAGLKRVKPFLRREVAARMQTKFIPDLSFAADESFDEAERILRLLHRPEVARDLAPHEDDSASDSDDDSIDAPDDEGTRGA